MQVDETAEASAGSFDVLLALGGKSLLFSASIIPGCDLNMFRKTIIPAGPRAPCGSAQYPFRAGQFQAHRIAGLGRLSHLPPVVRSAGSETNTGLLPAYNDGLSSSSGRSSGICGPKIGASDLAHGEQRVPEALKEHDCMAHH